MRRREPSGRSRHHRVHEPGFLLARKPCRDQDADPTVDDVRLDRSLPSPAAHHFNGEIAHRAIVRRATDRFAIIENWS